LINSFNVGLKVESMTRKDYKDFAEMLGKHSALISTDRNINEQSRGAIYSYIEWLTDEMCRAFKRDNKRFDSRTFLNELKDQQESWQEYYWEQQKVGEELIRL